MSSPHPTSPGPTRAEPAGTAPGRVEARGHWTRWTTISFLLGLASLAGVLGMWQLFVRTAWGQERDTMSYDAAREVSWWQARHAARLLDTVSVASIAAVMVAAALVALLRRRWLLASVVVGTIGASNVTTYMLKHHILTRHPLLDWAPWSVNNTLPSGHTTAAASAAVALVLVAPPRWRPVCALASAAVMGAFGYATLVAQFHRPADAIAGMLVCLGWGFAGSCVIAFRRAVGGSRANLTEPLAVGLHRIMTLVGAALLAGALALLMLPMALVESEHQTRSALRHAMIGATLGLAAVPLIGLAVLSSVLDHIDAPLTRDQAEVTPGT